jgi:outer membrane protein assembly factor BamB
MAPRRRRFPILLLICTALLAVFFAVSNLFRDELSDSLFSFDFAIVNIVTASAAAALFIGWLCWMWFLSGGSFWLSRGLPFVLVLSMLAGAVLYRPVFTGGISISRWEPRFWEWRNLAESEGAVVTALYRPSATDFSQYLGSRRDGVIVNFSVSLDNLDNLQRMYVQEIGEGWSGFVARNGYAITMEQRGNDECVVCYEIASGNVVWIHGHARRHADLFGGVGPRSTPTLDERRVFAMGANGMLMCLDIASGQLVWQQDLCRLLDIPLDIQTDRRGYEVQLERSRVVWGRAASPLLVDELVVVPAGGPVEGAQATLIAFRKEDGSEAWRAGEDGIAYASPALVELAGQRQIVVVNESTVTGHRPGDGSVLWSFDWPGNSNADANTSQAMQAGPNRLLLSKGYGAGGELIEITGETGNLQARSVWKNPRVLKTKLTSAVVSGQHAFALSDGILECVDLETGQRIWKRGRFGHGQLLRVEDRLLVHSEDGLLKLIEASPEGFRELGEVETVSGVCWNTLCAFDRFILVRSDIEMACFRVGDGQ